MRAVTSTIVTISMLAFSAASVQAATLSGTVTFSGSAPGFKAIKMDADPICLTKHTEPVYPESLVLGDGNTMGNVFVQIKSGLAKQAYPAPAEPVVLDHKGCQYTPHVAGIMVGQTLKILNPDGTLHNVHALSKVNTEFNLAMPKFRTETTKVFDKAEGMFAFKCDVHPWMTAWLTVMEHPYFSTTQNDGKFAIADLPAGTYEVEAWHEKLGTQVQSVTLAEGETKEVNFTFTKPEKK